MLLARSPLWMSYKSFNPKNRCWVNCFLCPYSAFFNGRQRRTLTLSAYSHSICSTYIVRFCMAEQWMNMSFLCCQFMPWFSDEKCACLECALDEQSQMLEYEGIYEQSTSWIIYHLIIDRKPRARMLVKRAAVCTSSIWSHTLSH